MGWECLFQELSLLFLPGATSILDSRVEKMKQLPESESVCPSRSLNIQWTLTCTIRAHFWMTFNHSCSNWVATVLFFRALSSRSFFSFFVLFFDKALKRRRLDLIDCKYLSLVRQQLHSVDCKERFGCCGRTTEQCAIPERNYWSRHQN